MTSLVSQAQGVTGKTFIKVQNGEVATIIEFSENPVNGFQPYQIADITVEQFDELESFPCDGTTFNFLENNRKRFDEMWASIPA